MTGAFLAVVLAGASSALPFVEDDFDAALAQAKARKVPLFVDAWAPWCHSCVFMKEHVLNQPGLDKLKEKYVFASVDTEKAKSAAFLEKYPVEVWPTLFIIDPQDGKTVLRFSGSANVEQFGKLLEDGERAIKGSKQDAEMKLAKADALFSAHQGAEAAVVYQQALNAAGNDWPRRGRALESLVTALYESKNYKGCARTALDETDKLPKGPSWANTVVWGMSCVTALPEKEGAEMQKQLTARAQEALKLDGLLADDRSGIYEGLVDGLEKTDPAASKKLALSWLEFLEGEAKKAPTPAARAVFDPHRLNAAIAAGVPERVLPALQQSEKDLPNDYNPPARQAIALRELGKYDEALAAAERALTKVYGPRKLRVLETKAQILAKKGDAAGRKKALTEALSFGKSLPAPQRPDKALARLQAEVDKK